MISSTAPVWYAGGMSDEIRSSCVRCGESFTPRIGGGGEQKYCSKQCQKYAVNQRMRERNREANRTDVPTACGECGVPIESNKFVVRKFCSDECKRRHHNRKTRRRNRTSLRNPEIRNCEHCGAEFTANISTKRYCKHNCAVAACIKRGTPVNGKHVALCDDCGSPFEAINHNARWCSKQCANRHWGRVRARKRGAVPQSPYSDREVFERDGWTCHVCAKSIDPGVPRTEPLGATVDHLKPISLGGHDIPENVAAAHRACNIDKMVGETDPETIARVLRDVLRMREH